MKKLVFTIATLALIALGHKAKAQVCFGTATNFGVGTEPMPVSSADFNNDGFQDLAVANVGSNNVSILLGNGAGSFSAATNFTVGTSPISISSADFDGDGKLDLATANQASNDVSVLLGNGAGSFSAATNFTVGTNPYSVSSADFNGDGKLDLAVANQASNDVSVLLGNGAGSFSAATNFTVGTNPYSVSAADFNGDSKMDLVTANDGSANVSVLLGNGAGSFGATTNFTVGIGPKAVTIADFDGDGKLDLATANYSANNVSVVLGNGAGSFGAAANFVVGTNPWSIVSADFDGDSKLDLATSNFASNNVSVLLGNGAGSFSTATNFMVGANPFSVSTADFNGDGRMDLAASNYSSNNVSVLLNYPVYTISIAATATTLCFGSSGTLTASGSATYYWWNTGDTSASISIAPTSSTTYYVSDGVGCSNTASITINVSMPSTPDICMVTVDSLSLNNLVIWNKTLYPAADSFLIYRDTANNDYALVGSVSKYALSEYTDTARHIGLVNGDPNITTYRYKLAIKDTCGNVGPMSLYHNTVYTYHSGSLFFWNQYGIEGQTSPVPALSSYSLKRDNLGATGNYVLAASAGASSTNINDPQYNTYQATADWRVETNWTISCTPTLRYNNNGVQTTIVRSKSNISNNRTTKVKSLDRSDQLVIYPNPSTGIFSIEANSSEKLTARVYNISGTLLLTQVLENGKTTIDGSVLPEGIYNVSLSGKAGVINKRLIIVR